MKHLDIIVSGKVQGVFYRASAQTVAGELGIRGFVRNEPDGSVFIAAEGRDELLERFVAWCHRGPARASVTGVTIHEGPLAGYDDFKVRRE